MGRHARQKTKNEAKRERDMVNGRKHPEKALERDARGKQRGLVKREIPPDIPPECCCGMLLPARFPALPCSRDLRDEGGFLSLGLPDLSLRSVGVSLRRGLLLLQLRLQPLNLCSQLLSLLTHLASE